MKFSFKTDSLDGILAYSNTTDGYLLVAIAKGFITVRIEQGDNVIFLEENDRLFGDDIWHDVTIRYDNQNIHLTVDDQLYSNWTSKPSEYIELTDNICFGGIPTSTEMVSADFIGSFGSVIWLNGETLDILEDSVKAVNIGNPDDSACDPYLCNSNGLCRPNTDGGFMCDCYFGYQGVNCEQGTI